MPNGIHGIWSDFKAGLDGETQIAFQQKVADSFKTLPCFEHANQIRSIKDGRWKFTVLIVIVVVIPFLFVLWELFGGRG